MHALERRSHHSEQAGALETAKDEHQRELAEAEAASAVGAGEVGAVAERGEHALVLAADDVEVDAGHGSVI